MSLFGVNGHSEQETEVEYMIVQDAVLFDDMICAQAEMELDPEDFWVIDEDGDLAAATEGEGYDRLYVQSAGNGGNIICARKAIANLMVNKFARVQIGENVFTKAIALQCIEDDA